MRSIGSNFNPGREKSKNEKHINKSAIVSLGRALITAK
jgi:hypothetical protein